MWIGRVYCISCGHRLSLAKEELFHGHNYRIEVAVEGEVDPKSGLIIDCHGLDAFVEPILQRLDHQTLNNVFDDVPTVENLTLWIGQRLWRQLKQTGSTGLRLRVWETDRIFAEEGWRVKHE